MLLFCDAIVDFSLWILHVDGVTSSFLRTWLRLIGCTLLTHTLEQVPRLNYQEPQCGTDWPSH